MKIALRTKFFYVLMCASLIAALAIGAQPLASAKAASPEACITTTTIAVANTGANPTYYHTDAQFTAWVLPGAAGPAMTGTVQFKSAGTDIGAPVNVTWNGANWIAVLTINSLQVGTHNDIRATYSGDGTYCTSTVPAAGAILHTVNPRVLTVGDPDAVDRIYNGKTKVNLTGTYLVPFNPPNLGIVAGDEVFITGLVDGGTMADKLAGNGKAVTTAYGLGGAQAGNYVMQQPVGVLVDIAQKELSVVGISAANKVYNGTPNATVNVAGATFGVGEVIVGDVVSLQAGGGVTGFFITGAAVACPVGPPANADRHVALDVADAVTAKKVSICGYSLLGADAINYTLKPIETTATITPRPVDFSPNDGNVTVLPREYDGTADVWNASWKLGANPLKLWTGVAADETGVMPQDMSAGAACVRFEPSLAPVISGTYNNANVGTNKPITATGFVVGEYLFPALPAAPAGCAALLPSPAKGTDYQLPGQPIGLTGTITKTTPTLGLMNAGVVGTYNGSPWVADLRAWNPHQPAPVNPATLWVAGVFEHVTYTGVLPGTVYGPSETPPVNAGTYNLTITKFTPTDLDSYKTVEPVAPATTIYAGQMQILQYNPGFYIANTPAAYTGSPIVPDLRADSYLLGAGWTDVPGTFANVRYNGSTTVPMAVGTYLVTWDSFTPTDAINYSTSGWGQMNFVISNAPTLSITNPSVPYNGLAQAANVIGSVPGTVWNVRYDGSATVPTNAGTYAVIADFIPTDSSYLTMWDAPAGNFVITKVDPPAPVLAVTGSPVTYDGAAHAAGVTVVSTTVPGSVANILTGGAMTQTAVGTYPVTADFVPFNTNYTTLTGLAVGNFVIAPTLPIELIINGGFNTYTGTSMIPSYWDASKFSAIDGKSNTRKEGLKSVRIQGNAVRKMLSQEILSSGSAGSHLTFKFWVKGQDIPAGGVCNAQVRLYNGSTLVQVKTVACPTGTYSWTSKAVSFNAFGDYTKVVIRITYFKASGYVWFDGVSLIK